MNTTPEPLAQDVADADALDPVVWTGRVLAARFGVIIVARRSPGDRLITLEQHDGYGVDRVVLTSGEVREMLELGVLGG